jgi:hypothetical protein
MGWMGHIQSMKEMRTKFLSEYLTEGDRIRNSVELNFVFIYGRTQQSKGQI